MRKLGRLISGSIILTLFFSLCGCEKIAPPEKNRDERVLARINNYKMMVSDFNYEKKPFLNFAPLGGDPEKLKSQVLNQLITRQLLLQEAQKLNLDKDKAFMKEIENYWKQALLTSLLKKKSEELKAGISVTEAEIEQEYASMQRNLLDEKDPRGLEPLEKMKAEISERIRKEKITRSLEAWVNGLRQEAQVNIDPKVLEGIKLD